MPQSLEYDDLQRIEQFQAQHLKRLDSIELPNNGHWQREFQRAKSKL